MSEQPLIEKSLEELDSRLVKQIEGVKKNLKKNPAYAIELCQTVLTREPGCVEVRKLLHEAYRATQQTATSGFSKLFKSVTRAPFALMGTNAKKDPRAALDAAEKQISADPSAIGGYKLLGEAASLLGLWQTAIMVLESLRKIETSDVTANLLLAEAYLTVGRAREAIALGDAVNRDNPGNQAAADLIRKASVAVTVERGKYDKAESFRESLADAKKSVELEQSARTVNDAETHEAIIAKLMGEIAESPENLVLYRKLIDSYKAIAAYSDAVVWIQKARETPNGKSDPTLERLELDMREKEQNVRVEQARAKLKANPEDEHAAQEIAMAEATLAKLRLANAQFLVDRYPNDYQARFRLGELLLENDQLDKAISEFQLAQRNPQVRIKALLLTGRAMLQKGMADLAIEQLKTANDEVLIMNDLKKDIIYELGLAHEANKDSATAINEFKKIYTADIGYKDVAKRINDFYSRR